MFGTSTQTPQRFGGAPTRTSRITPGRNRSSPAQRQPAGCRRWLATWTSPGPGSPADVANSLRPVSKVWCILLEDVDRKAGGEAGLNDLLDLIEAGTAVGGIRWCLGANLDNLNAVLSAERPFFWATYGVVPAKKANTAGAAIDGWIDLDALNASESLGLRLLDRLVADERPDLRTMLDHRRAFQNEADTYANPLPAWMRYEAMTTDPRSRPVSDPQDPVFIRQYWSFLKLRQLKPADPARARSRMPRWSTR